METKLVRKMKYHRFYISRIVSVTCLIVMLILNGSSFDCFAYGCFSDMYVFADQNTNQNNGQDNDSIDEDMDDDPDDIPKQNNVIKINTDKIVFPLTLLKKGDTCTYKIDAEASDEAQLVFNSVSVPSEIKKYIKIFYDGSIKVKHGIKKGNYTIRMSVRSVETDNYLETNTEFDVTVIIRDRMTSRFPSLKKVGVKNYSSKVNSELDQTMEGMCFFASGLGDFKKLSKEKKAIIIPRYAAYRYRYGNAYTAKDMLEKGYGTCFAYSELVYLIAKKSGLKNTWITVPGKNVNHDGLFYGSYHRSVVTKIGKKYYEMDGNIGVCMQISESYAKYLLGKSKTYKKIRP